MGPRAALLSWYDRARRRLPWRETADPYAIAVAEAMLQQTRAATATAYWSRFLAEFPTVRALAEADEDRVLRAWAGLGYYRRARLLRAAAVAVASSGWPRTRSGLAELPGFGPYTSAAVAAIAFGEPVLAVDGNVRRVARRFFADLDERNAVRRAEALVDASRPGDSNQALFDLGATICVPRNPRCGACPVALACAGRSNPSAFDPPARRAPPREVEVTALLARRGDRVLLVRREEGLLGGTWALPFREGGPKAWGRRAGRRLAVLRHRFTHVSWNLAVHECRGSPPGAWTRPSDVAVATVFRKAIEAAASRETVSGRGVRGKIK